MDQDLPRPDVPRPLVAGSQELSSTLSHLYGSQRRQSSADEALISRLETSLPTRPDPLHADLVHQLTGLRDSYVQTRSNLESVERHLLRARAARLAGPAAAVPAGAPPVASLEVLQQTKKLTELDSSMLRKYQLLVPEDFCSEPPKPVEPAPRGKRLEKTARDEVRPLTGGGSVVGLETILPQLARVVPQTRQAVSSNVTAHLVRAEPAEVRLDSFQVNSTYELRLCVKNVSCSLLWLRLVPPTTPQFQLTKITFPGAQCTLAPGLSLEARLTFRAQRRRTFRDRLLVVTPLGELTVPLLASHRPPVLLMDASIEMGEALVGCRKRRSVTVTNEGGHGQFRVLRSADWPGKPPEDSGPQPDLDGASFAVKPDRFKLDTGESVQLEVCFVPVEAGQHRETLTLVCDNAQVRHVMVRGCGVRGVARLVNASGEFHQPAVGQRADKYCQWFLRLPDTLPKLEVSTPLRLSNTSGVQLRYRWEPRLAALDVYGQDALDVSAGDDTHVSQPRGMLQPFEEVEVTFRCVTGRLGERRVVWSLLLENMPETALDAEDVRFEPGWPRPGLMSRLERRPAARRNASLSCLQRLQPIDLHAPRRGPKTRSRSLSPTGRPPIWDALACEVQILCRCQPLPLSLEPPLLRLPDPVPFWSRVTRAVTLVNDSPYAAPFRWETVRRGDLLVSVSPHEGEVPARGRRPLTVTLWSAREMQLTAELRCTSRRFGRSVCLPVVASFLGPTLQISTHRLEMPRTRVGERSERQLTLTNATKLPLEWRTARIVERSAVRPAERGWRFDGQVDPFSVIPGSGVLRAGERNQLTVAFKPPAPASYDMVLDVSVDGSSRSCSVSVSAEAYHLSLAVTPAFHKLDAYVGGTVSMMVFVSNTCDLDVPFSWEVPRSESVRVTLEPAASVLLPWATLVSELQITGLQPGPYGYYCIPCWLEDRSFSAPLTLYGEVTALSLSVHIAPNWGHRPTGVPDLGEGRQVLGRSRRREMERQEREAQEEAARRAAQPPPEPERPSTPPPEPKSKKDKKKSAKTGKKGKKKGGKEEKPPTPEPEPEPEPSPPEPERSPTPEPTVEELLAEWELVEPEEAGCGPLVLLFGHDVGIHSVVVREFHVHNDTPIAMQCNARVLNFPGMQQEHCVGEPPLTVEKRRINDLEREDVWSDLLSDGRGLALLVRPSQFTTPAHSQTLVRVFCCADMWGWYRDQLVVSGKGIPDLAVDLRVGVTGSPILAVNTGSNHVRFGCQLYGGAPVERHLCLNNVSPCPIQLDMAVALQSPAEGHAPPFRTFLSLGTDFEPLLPLWEWRVTSDTLRLGLRPVFGHESQVYYTVTPRVTVVPARAKVWVLLQLHPVCLPPATSHWEWERRQRPVDVLAWLTAHCSLREQDRAPPGGLVTRWDGYDRQPLQVQLHAQLRSAYLSVVYPEPAAVGFRPPPVLAGSEEAVRLVAPVTALVEGHRRSEARLLSRLTLHNRHQVDVEVLCWTTLPFVLVRAASQRGAVERPGRCVVPHSGHAQLTVEFVFSRALLRFCLTERLPEPRRVRFSPTGEAELLNEPDWSEGSDDCQKEEEGEGILPENTRSEGLLTGSERAPSLAGSDAVRADDDCRARTRSEPNLATDTTRLSDSLQDLLCSRSAQMTAEQRAADYCLREVEVLHLTTETGEERVRFRSKLVLQYMDSHIQAFPVECVLALPALSVSSELIQFHQVTIGDVARRGFYISNPTIGELGWSTRLVPRLPSPQASATGRLGRRRSTRLAPRRPDAATFRLTPEFGVLAPRARQHVAVTFTPPGCAIYSATLELSGPCLPDPVCVLITGEGTHDELPHMPGT